MLRNMLIVFDNCPLADFANDRKSIVGAPHIRARHRKPGFSQDNRVDMLGFTKEVDKIKAAREQNRD